MSKYLVRYQNRAGEYIGYDVEAEDVYEAYHIGSEEFDNDDPDKTAGYQLEGVYSYENDTSGDDD